MFKFFKSSDKTTKISNGSKKKKVRPIDKREPDITNNIDVRKKITCQKCHKFLTTYVRIFDYKMLPNEFFKRPDPSVEFLLNTSTFTETNIYPNFWVQLPKELNLTKYPFKVCDGCYQIEKDIPLNIWNQWIEQ